ncbi:MAG: TIGR01458 family HAD-type hydrolase [Methanolinea sp.]|nr:TIGR01458 family HAD-type hydrolase [Methanolinea sp.]
MKIRYLLLDLDGVLYAGNLPIPGAAETLAWLTRNDYTFRFISNTTRRSRTAIARRLARMGLDIPQSAIFTPAIAATTRIRNLGGSVVHLLATGEVCLEFEESGLVCRQEGADFVVIGDAGDAFTYQDLTAAFRNVLRGVPLLALERDRYWMGEDGLLLSAGPFVAAIEYATSARSELMGKPSPNFFRMALESMGAVPEETAMVGDDVITDTVGAMECGMRGILVRTGKFREDTLRAAPRAPDVVIDSIADLPAFLTGGIP